MSQINLLGRIMDGVDCAPWGAVAGRHVPYHAGPSQTLLQRIETASHRHPGRPLYTPEEKRRRDASPWTMVQGILAPLQFLVFLVSLVLVFRFLATGQGEQAATASVVVKTLVLYTIMVTGSFWERAIFGRFLFAPAFFWEDAVSMVVIALHTAYLAALLSGSFDSHRLMVIALAAYASYVVNATQFILKLRAARHSDAAWSGHSSADRLGHI